MAALSTAHLNALPDTAAEHPAAAACLCIADAQADSASCIAASNVPIITALEALPSHMQAPLGELISVQRLGDATLQAVRNILAYHIPSIPKLDSKVWSVLKQCSIFENADGSMTDLTQPSLLLMPNAAWEQAMLAAPQLVSNQLVRYHAASDAQQKLLKHSGLKPRDLVDFLYALIRCIQTLRHPMAEPLLLQALDELADHPYKSSQYPDSLLVDGKPHSLYYMVDSSSKLLKALFQGSPDGLTLLPEKFAQKRRLAVLKRCWTRDEDSHDPSHAQCAQLFVKLAPGMSRVDRVSHSISLVNMWQSIIPTSSYNLGMGRLHHIPGQLSNFPLS